MFSVGVRAHACRASRVAEEPRAQLFGLREEAGETGEKPYHASSTQRGLSSGTLVVPRMCNTPQCSQGGLLTLLIVTWGGGGGFGPCRAPLYFAHWLYLLTFHAPVSKLECDL